MAGANEIKARITGVQSTEKITNAMYLISSVKMQKAKRGQQAAMPFFISSGHELSKIFSYASDYDSPYFAKEGRTAYADDRVACLVVTADRGLAGSYNHNVIKRTERLVKKHPDIRLYIIGEYGRRYFDRHGIPYQESFNYFSQPPTMREARQISSLLLGKYDDGKIDSIYAVYTEIQGAHSQEVKAERILPFSRDRFARRGSRNNAAGKEFSFYPSVGEVLDTGLRSMFTGFIYGALSDSYLSEQNSRMAAMDSANKNAGEILERLKLQYNQARQDSVTNEITEISAGQQAQKRREKKETLAKASFSGTVASRDGVPHTE